MDSNKFEEFKSKLERRMANLDAKLSYMREGLDGFQKEFKDFQTAMGDFVAYAVEEIADHGKRLDKIEKHLNL